MKRAIRFFSFFMIVGGLSFILSRFFQDNSDPIQVQLFGWQTKSVSTGFFVTLTFFSGVVLSFLLIFTSLIAKTIETSRLKRENIALQKMLEEKTHSSSSKI